jgi:hypothetical protein
MQENIDTNERPSATLRCAHGNPGACGFCWSDQAPKCKHGNPGACGFCWSDQAPKCKHGNPGACGFCIGARVTSPLWGVAVANTSRSGKVTFCRRRDIRGAAGGDS